MEAWVIKIHSIEYHNLITEKDNLVAARSMYPYKDGLGMQHILIAQAGE